MTIPPKLKKGNGARVIAPSRSLAIISQETRDIANKRFKELGLDLNFAKNAEEKDNFTSSSISSRVEDIHQAFQDPKVQLIITAIGGFNSNQLLPYLNYQLIKDNPKVVCGYSDITALTNAIYAKTGLVTYSGPHYSSFGEKLYFDYTLRYFKKCLFSKNAFEVSSSGKWSDDEWYINQDKRHLKKNPGYTLINPGKAEGTIIGGNLGTLQCLAGTAYMPSLKNSILFLEDDAEEKIHHFDRLLTALSQLPDFLQGVKGIVIGRFEPKSNVSVEDVKTMIHNNPKLNDVPIIYGADFGHTDPKITFPIGGRARLRAQSNSIKIEILEH